jgi:hypothetical protein
MAKIRASERLRASCLVAGMGIASGVVLASVAPAEVARAKGCSPDGGRHVAKVRLHVTRTSIYGYAIKYTRRAGFRLGDTNNERVFYRVRGDPGDIRRPLWGSPDSGAPGTWIGRDQMPDLDHAHRFYIDAEFDKRDDDDPVCTIKWRNDLP